MSLYHQIISNRRRGLLAGAARAGFYLLSLPYGVALGARNWAYDTLAKVHWLDRPCISIGNLTAGGTGKTPVVIWLAGRLIAQGKKVAILSRGYKGGDAGGDELQLTSAACPQAICVANPDRVLAGQYAIAEHDVDVVLLDDAFQHRRIGRDLDVVLVDASCPWGHGYLLPRGLLRESVSALARADLIAITRVNQVSPEQLAALQCRCRQLAPDVPIVGCSHRATRLQDIDGTAGELSQLSGRSIVAFAGIGNPDGFLHTLKHIGAKPLHFLAFADHHRYGPPDCRAICAAAERSAADMLLTTEKDMVKLRRLGFDWPVPLRSLQIAIDFGGGGGKMFMQLASDVTEQVVDNNDTDALPAH